MLVSAKRMAVLREHIRAESEHDMDALLGGMTPDCFNDVVGVPKPFVGPEQTAERYRKHWEGFPDFTVRVRRVLCADESCVVTENEWRGTHLGTFLGWPPTGKPVKIRAVVVWHFKGDDLWGETIFFDNASILKQIGAKIDIPPPSGSMKLATFTLDNTPLIGSRNGIRVKSVPRRVDKFRNTLKVRRFVCRTKQGPKGAVRCRKLLRPHPANNGTEH
jgi:steroid delta-isomerase-like uncharacterized protein